MTGKQDINNTQSRQYHFDSMRGIAACMVAIAHFLAAFYPYAVFGPHGEASQISNWESVVLYPPFSLLSAGHFAVCLFFVLSGYVLSIRIIGEMNQFSRLAGAIVKRPVRLGGVLVFSLFCAGILFEFEGFYHQQAAVHSGSNWLAQFWNIDFSWIELAKKIVTFRAGSEYNPPLWTLRIELIGSFVVFGLLLLINWMPYRFRTIILCCCLIGFFNTFYAGFVWGMLLADTKKQGYVGQLPVKYQRIGFAAALFLASFPYYAAKTSISSAETPTPLLLLITNHIPMLSAVAIMTLVMCSPLLQAGLQRRFLIWLGEISYALYAIHLLIIGSILSYLQANASISLGYGYASLVNVVVYLSILLILSGLVTKVIDEPAVKLANRIDLKARHYANRLQMVFDRQVNRFEK